MKISLLCSVFGLIGLWLVTTTFSESVTISSLNPDQTGSVVKVCGNIIYKVVSKAGHVFMKLSDDSGKIDIVVFNTSVERFEIPKLNDYVCVTGRLELYEGRLEILPSKIQIADHQD